MFSKICDSLHNKSDNFNIDLVIAGKIKLIEFSSMANQSSSFFYGLVISKICLTESNQIILIIFSNRQLFKLQC